MTSPLDFAKRNGDSFVQLFDLLRIPSVSTDPTHAPDILKAARWMAEMMNDVGLTGVRVDPTPGGHPVVYGEWLGAPGAPTVLLYGHYDVQPPDPLDLWTSAPFDPQVRDGCIVARGSSDDKGQVFIWLKAIEAWMKTGGRLPINVKFMIEGEEEIGSPHLAPWIKDHIAQLAADVAVVSDTAWAAPGVPNVTMSLRGLVYMELLVRGPNHDLHSGEFGGDVRNPANALCQIIGRLHDEKGRVTIPGFYDDVLQLTASERTALLEVPFDEAAFLTAAGHAAGHGAAGFSRAERLTTQPTLDVNGMSSGWTGKGAKTIIPDTAMAKVSMRLVPHQNPQRIADLFAEYVQTLAPTGVTVEVSMHTASPWALTDVQMPAIVAASAAYEAGFGRRPVYSRSGGSIPVVARFQDLLGIDTVLMGFGLPEDGIHGPNESFRVENFVGGIVTAIAFMEEYARQH